jgi:hypothetical protein
MKRTTTTRTRKEQEGSRRYLWEIAGGAIVFLVLFLFLPELIRTEKGSTESILVALVPLVPVVWMVVAVARHIGRIDEFQKIFVFQSLAIGFAAAMLIAITVAFLSTADVTVAYPEWYVFIGGMSVWGISMGVLSFRASR